MVPGTPTSNPSGQSGVVPPTPRQVAVAMGKTPTLLALVTTDTTPATLPLGQCMAGAFTISHKSHMSTQIRNPIYSLPE